MPTFAISASATGNWKATPNAKIIFMTRSRYSPTFGMSWIGMPPSPAGTSKLAKNRHANGNTK